MTKTRLALRAAAVWGVLVALLAIGAALPGRTLPAMRGLGDTVPGVLPVPEGFSPIRPGTLGRADGRVLVAEVLDRAGRGVGDVLTGTFGRPTRATGGVDVAGRSGVLHVHDVLGAGPEDYGDGGGPQGMIVAAGPLGDDAVLAVILLTPGPPTDRDQRLLEQVAAEVRPVP